LDSLLDQAIVHKGDVRSRGRKADARATGVREQRGGEKAEADERERHREQGDDGRSLPLAVCPGEDAGAGDHDARCWHERGRPRVHGRSRLLEVLDDHERNVVFALAGGDAFVDLVLERVERRDRLPHAIRMDVKDPPPPSGALPAHRRECTDASIVRHWNLNRQGPR